MMLKQISRLPHFAGMYFWLGAWDRKRHTDRNGEQFPVPSAVFAQISESFCETIITAAQSVNVFLDIVFLFAQSTNHDIVFHSLASVGRPIQFSAKKCRKYLTTKYHDKARHWEKPRRSRETTMLCSSRSISSADHVVWFIIGHDSGFSPK